jgi:hypothetical protein
LLDVAAAEMFPLSSSRQRKPYEDIIRQPFATTACEGEGVGQGGTDVLFDCIPEQVACAIKPCSDGLGAKAQELCRLLDAHFLDHARDQHGSKGIRQVIDRPFQDELNLALRHDALGVELHGRKRERCHLTVRELLILDGGEFDRRTATADAPQRFIQDDARELGREA